MIAYWTDVVNGRRGIVPAILRWVFLLLSFFFRLARAIASWAIEEGIIKRRCVNIPVVAVGNIVAGGTGKTPLIDFLAKCVDGSAVLSRGYCSESVRKNVRVSAEMSAAQCGDEPLLLCKKGHNVFVGRNRFVSAQMAEKAGAKLALLDDGMQQKYVKSDVIIGVLHGKKMFGNGFFLPRGYLRDSPRKLKSVDLVVVNHADEDFSQAESRLRKWTNAPIVGMRPTVCGAYGINGPVELEGKKVRIFCAIGNPEEFVKSVKGLGAQVIDVATKPDHANFRTNELRDDDVDYLVCTEKDWVKLLHPSKKMVHIKIELTVVNNERNMSNFLDQVRQLVKEKNGGTK